VAPADVYKYEQTRFTTSFSLSLTVREKHLMTNLMSARGVLRTYTEKGLQAILQSQVHIPTTTPRSRTMVIKIKGDSLQ
jgi:hypothetical protein